MPTYLPTYLPTYTHTHTHTHTRTYICTQLCFGARARRASGVLERYSAAVGYKTLISVF